MRSIEVGRSPVYPLLHTPHLGAIAPVLPKEDKALRRALRAPPGGPTCRGLVGFEFRRVV
jgi:hypothetical protein